MTQRGNDHDRQFRPNRHSPLLAFVILLGLAFWLISTSVLAQHEYSRRVLIVYDQSDRLDPISDFDVALRKTMEQGIPGITFEREFLDNEISDAADSTRFSDEFRRWIRNKYAREPIDLLITFGGRPFRLASQCAHHICWTAERDGRRFFRRVAADFVGG